MSMNLVTTLYLIASICFIQALKGLSHPTTSRRGNLFGMLGMALAVLTTVGVLKSPWPPPRTRVELGFREGVRRSGESNGVA